MENGIKSHVDAAVSRLVERDNEAFHRLQGVANMFRPTGETSRTTGASSAQTSQQDEVVQEGHQEEENSPRTPTIPPTRHYLRPKQPNLLSLYNEWYGLDDYCSKPVPGGIQRLEEDHKAKWRKHFSKGEARQFTRTKTVVNAID